MKTLFLHASIKKDVLLPEEVYVTLPKRVGLFTNIQYLKQVPKVKKQLEARGKEVSVVGQTLGCRAEAAQKVDVDAFLFIGSGEFHPVLVAWETETPVWCYNPELESFSLIPQERIDRYKKRRRASLVKFVSAKTVGILITTKVGQNDNKINVFSEGLKMKGALELLERADKEYYVFAFDTLELNRLEDFPFIDCWVNTACSRIVDDKTNIINLDEVRAFYKEQKEQKSIDR